MYVVLHNQHDNFCREWIAKFVPDGCKLVDFYAEQQQWIDDGGTLQISAFPTVITPSGAIIRQPENWDVVVEAESNLTRNAG